MIYRNITNAAMEKLLLQLLLKKFQADLSADVARGVVNDLWAALAKATI
jgi:hypothetical protein